MRLQEDRNIEYKEDKIILNTENYNVSIYLKLIPNLLNEVLIMLSTYGKYLNKYYDIFIQPCNNIIKEKFDLCNTYEKYIICTKQSNSGYMEIMGNCKIYFEFENDITFNIVEGKITDVKNIDINDIKLILYYKSIYNTNDPLYKFKFISKYKSNKLKKILIEPYNCFNFRIKQLSLYNELFNKPISVYEYSKSIKINLKDTLNDFYKLNDTNIFIESKMNLITYKNTRMYSWEDDSNLIIDNTQQAIWRINYFSYPNQLGKNNIITNEQLIEVVPEVYPLILLYIEGKIRIIREMDYGNNLLSEFEQKRTELLNNQFIKSGVDAYFEDVKGWL